MSVPQYTPPPRSVDSLLLTISWLGLKFIGYIFQPADENIQTKKMCHHDKKIPISLDVSWETSDNNVTVVIVMWEQNRPVHK